jgi:3-deoxy-D-manno-octulosonic-acid transferase
MRLLYSLLIAIAAPWALAWTWWRGLRDPAYRDRIGERLGFTRLRFDRGCYWIHAASVGEIQACAPLIRALLERFADLPWLVTTTTPTGAQRVRTLFGDSVRHCFLPYDTPGSVRRFLGRVNPRIGVIVETELWPNLYWQCKQTGVPMVLASARLSPRSFPRYRRLASLFKASFGNVQVAAQTEEDAQRFRELGAANIHAVGNIKFDMELAPTVAAAGRALREEQFAQRPVWIAASTHEGEEAAALDAHGLVRATLPNALLILVPRHPQRFSVVRELLQRSPASFAVRSERTPVKNAAVLLIDTMGELMLFYAASDVAFVGGTLAPVGGHNFLEPAALALPILSGPHVFNAQVLCDQFFAAGAAIQVHTANELAKAVIELLNHPQHRAAMGGIARNLIEVNRGALARVMEIIAHTIERAKQVKG